MIKPQAILFSVVFMTLFSTNILADVTSNPFKNSLAITKKNLPNALGAMWQSEHLIWRAQLFNAACRQNLQPIKYAVNAGFPLVNQYITDQGVINGELNQGADDALTDANATFILHDTNKVAYQIFSEVYAYAYVRRLRIIQQFHPEISAELCAHAEKTSQQYPVDAVSTLPWQITNQTEFKTWRADLFSMRIVNKYFVTAFINRQKAFAHLIDAEIYAMMQGDEKAVSAFSEISESYQYQALLMNEITQAYQQAKGKKIPAKLWHASYGQEASTWASQAYKLATVSALMQIKTLYPDLYQRIETHAISYIKLQLSNIDESKSQLNEAFNTRE